MRFIYFSLALTLGLLVPWTNCQSEINYFTINQSKKNFNDTNYIFKDFSWPDLYNSTSASPTSYPTTPSPPSIYNQTADVISEALHVISEFLHSRKRIYIKNITFYAFTAAKH